GRVLHLPRDRERVLRNATRMSKGVGVVAFRQDGECTERREDIVFAILEQPRVVDGYSRLSRQLGDEVLVVGRESVADLIVGEEEHAYRLGAQRDRDAENCSWIERARGDGASLHGL